MRIPDYISPFVAYRVWQWDAEGVKSLNNTVWQPREPLVASCPDQCRIDEENKLLYDDVSEWERHEVPELSCSCGLYAAKNWSHLINIGYAQSGIHGEVSLWGKIVDCSLGYRAQYAYPRHFIVPPNMLTWDMKDVEKRLKTLIEFNVDIYVSKHAEPKVEIEKVLLWVPDFGFTKEGTNFLLERIQRYYSYRDDMMFKDPQPGDRLAIADAGISIIQKVTDKQVVAMLYNQSMYRLPREAVVWNRPNNRWETTTKQAYVFGVALA